MIKNRVLTSYIYNGWRIKEALTNAAKNKDIRLKYLPHKYFNIDIPYLMAFNNQKTYKLKLTTEEAEYLKFLKQQL
ncbi:MAG: hypothetical protein Athens071426_414 [Parcubacteria group bacterium Athens0714_26]|nr:MAG: hypothetical protein Athens071426_414 [Parcubacteria group bacterium Athens0714_26]